jgi:hypothetical protein
MPTHPSTDAIALPKADHSRSLIAQHEKAKGPNRKKDLANQIYLELAVHTKIEEDVFYPGCREDCLDEDLLAEATKALGQQMSDEKKTLTAKHKSEGLPKPTTPIFTGAMLA